MKSKLICACNKAAQSICDRCLKYKQLSPDVTLNCTKWARNLNDIARRVADGNINSEEIH